MALLTALEAACGMREDPVWCYPCRCTLHGHTGGGGRPVPAVRAAAGADRNAPLVGQPRRRSGEAAAGGVQGIRGSGWVEG